MSAEEIQGNTGIVQWASWICPAKQCVSHSALKKKPDSWGQVCRQKQLFLDVSRGNTLKYRHCAVGFLDLSSKTVCLPQGSNFHENQTARARFADQNTALQTKTAFFRCQQRKYREIQALCSGLPGFFQENLCLPQGYLKKKSIANKNSFF